MMTVSQFATLEGSVAELVEQQRRGEETGSADRPSLL